MTPESAEMTKYVANCLLATKISFINEMANLCERYGADINEVRRGIGHDSRIGFSFLFPGVGYGGSCFPKDIRAVIHMAQPARRARADDGGGRRGQRGAEGGPGPQDPRPFRGRGEGQDRGRSGAWPSSRKTDDIREAPALVLIDALLEAGVSLRVHDPEAMANVRAIYGDRLVYCDRPYGALEGADALAIVTEWNEFRNPDFDGDAAPAATTRSSSTAATCTTRRGWPRWASPTTASAVPPPRPRSPRSPTDRLDRPGTRTRAASE